MPSAMSVIGDCVRGMVTCEPGNVLLCADFSNVEGRVLAWLAGEQWKLRAFEANDNGTGPDLYKLAYANAFEMSPDSVDKSQRQVGKVMELALGYQGGVGAFQQMAAGYGVQIGEQYDFFMGSVADETIDRAEYGFESRGKTSGIIRETWLSAEIVKILWRDNHPAVVQYWADMNEAAVNAVKTGKTWKVGNIRFFTRGSFLYMILPSGRRLSYAFPFLGKKKLPWKDKDGNDVYGETIFYKAVDSTTNQWRLHDTYGGKLVENACQAVARDLLAHSMFELEKAGYPLILTVHDEALSEIALPDDCDEEKKKFIEIFTQKPAWADGLPLAGDGWYGERYRK